MKKTYKKKLKEVLTDLIDILDETELSETKLSFTCGELSMLIDLIKSE